MSLNNLIDNVLQIMRNNNVAESEHISRHQIALWIHYYRAYLIKQWIDKDREIDEIFTQTLEPVHLDREETVPGKFVYVSEITLPKLIAFNQRSGVIAVRDMYGNIIQLGSQTKAKLQKYRKATCGDYIAWVKGDRVYVEGDSNQLEYISIDVIAENPEDLGECFDPDGEYPIPASMVPTIVQMIMERELRTLVQMPSDITNDSKDDNQNRVR